MTTDITPENVAKMQEGVTPGPWRDTGGENNMIEADIPVAYYVRASDRRFIAYAREAVPALAARLAEVEAAHERTAEVLDGYIHLATDVMNRAEAAGADVQALKAELAAADRMVTAEARSSLDRLARAEAAEAEVEALKVDRDRWAKNASDTAADYVAMEARVEAAETENAKLREFFDAVDAFSAIPRPSPIIEMIERVNRARAALQETKK
jgi:hypothetical protein